jgi:hypothetical protein
MAPRPLQDDGILQLAAGISLLRMSNLVLWTDELLRFELRSEDAFEHAARDVDLLFGRLVKWMQFSAGFEFVLKGVLLLAGKDFRVDDKSVVANPTAAEMHSGTWHAGVRTRTARREPTVKYRELGTLIDQPTFLREVVAEQLLRQTNESDANRVLAACEFLRDAVRNRDAHAYVPNVRQQQYVLVTFVAPALNTLLSWVDEPLLREHRERASAIIRLTADDPYTLENLDREDGRLNSQNSLPNSTD